MAGVACEVMAALEQTLLQRITAARYDLWFRDKTKFTLEAVQLDPGNGAWLLDRPPLMPAQSFDTREEWEARIDQARSRFGRG